MIAYDIRPEDALRRMAWGLLGELAVRPVRLEKLGRDLRTIERRPRSTDPARPAGRVSQDRQRRCPTKADPPSIRRDNCPSTPTLERGDGELATVGAPPPDCVSETIAGAWVSGQRERLRLLEDVGTGAVEVYAWRLVAVTAPFGDATCWRADRAWEATS